MNKASKLTTVVPKPYIYLLPLLQSLCTSPSHGGTCEGRASIIYQYAAVDMPSGWIIVYSCVTEGAPVCVLSERSLVPIPHAYLLPLLQSLYISPSKGGACGVRASIIYPYTIVSIPSGWTHVYSWITKCVPALVVLYEQIVAPILYVYLPSLPSLYLYLQAMGAYVKGEPRSLTGTQS